MGYIKTTLNIREDLFLKGKILASIKGVTFSDILNESLEEYLKAHENEIRERLSNLLK